MFKKITDNTRDKILKMNAYGMIAILVILIVMTKIGYGDLASNLFIILIPLYSIYNIFISKKICKGFDDEDKRLYSLSWRLQTNAVTIVYVWSGVVLMAMAYIVFHVLKDLVASHL
ncbi:MAG: hypothetical protein VX185_05030 [Pseudomonadota bacterium]|nr:hypothetical protein [Pseudomonadota bacterium]